MKYTKLERNWVMYDVGNSALVLLNTSVVPIYFNAINTGASSADLVVAWGNAQTIASLVIAMLMPILGALADYAGNKIKFFLGFFLTGLVLCLAQAIPMSAMAFLTVYVLCTIGLNSSMTFYDAMLPDITTDERMDAVSSSGYAWGYLGSTVPFVICLALIMGIEEKNRTYYEVYSLPVSEHPPEGYQAISLVCVRQDGRYESPATVSNVCQVAKKRVDGMESFHFHQLRHTFTSNLLSYGAAPKDVQELLGHSDVTTTMNIYAHASREAKRDAAKLLDKVQ